MTLLRLTDHCVIMCVCVRAHCFTHMCLLPAWTPHHLALVRQDHLNERQAAPLSSMQLDVALIAKDNCRQNDVHSEERSWVIIRSGLEARNKCPCVIDYMLQANEINRAWIDSVESCQRGVRSRVQWLYWHAHIQRPSQRDQAVLLVEYRDVSSFAAGSCFAHHCNQGQCCSNQMRTMGSDKLDTYHYNHC